MSAMDRIRERGWRVMDRLGGRLGETARRMNDALGRPLANEEELADRRAFAARYREVAHRAGSTGAVAASPAQLEPPASPIASPIASVEPAPVCLYTLDDKRRGDIPKIRQILDDAEVPYTVLPLDADPAALAAVRRDSGGKKPPLVFVAGESIGGRLELVNLGRDGLRKRVFGGGSNDDSP